MRLDKGEYHIFNTEDRTYILIAESVFPILRTRGASSFSGKNRSGTLINIYPNQSSGFMGDIRESNGVYFRENGDCAFTYDKWELVHADMADLKVAKDIISKADNPKGDLYKVLVDWCGGFDFTAETIETDSQTN